MTVPFEEAFEEKFAKRSGMNEDKLTETITLGGGCFWCVEAVFNSMIGVESAISGYMGGVVSNPTYRDVCTGQTGHAEVVKVTFDPTKVTLRDILEVFFIIHDPTTLNRQGADTGTQYRSAIFYDTEAQKQTASLMMSELKLSNIYDAPIVTELASATKFYVAEDYHQEYYFANSSQPYCCAVISPKMEKFRKLFKERVRER